MLVYNSAECLRPLVQISTRRIKAHLLSFFSFGSLENRARFNGGGAKENLFLLEDSFGQLVLLLYLMRMCCREYLWIIWAMEGDY